MTTTLTTRPGGPAGQVWRSLGKSAAARILILPLTAVLGIVATRLIIDNYGEVAYVQYGLLVGLGALLPFADLGLSAVIMNAVGGSSDPRSDEELRLALLTCIRLLCGSAVCVVAVAVLLTLTDAWTVLLGQGLLPGKGLVAGCCVALIGVTLPFGIGQRILNGLGKNHITILLMGLQSPLVLCTLLGLTLTHTEAGLWLAVLPYSATFLLSIVTVVLAARWIHPTFTGALRDSPRVSTVRGVKVSNTAWPMLVQMIAVPIAMQTDRIILIHFASESAVASYNLAAQMFMPIWMVASAAGLALWPLFARHRARALDGATGAADSPSPKRLALLFAAVAATGGVTLSLLSPFLAHLASGGVISLSPLLVVAFTLLVTVQSTKIPLGTFMTDAPGLQYQAKFIVLMLLINLPLSCLLAARWGAPGPIIGSIIAVLLCEVVANWVYITRKAAGAR